MNKTSWIIFSVATICIFVALGVVSNSNKIDLSNIDANKVQEASIQNGKISDHIFGNKDSKVTLIEYADYQCPGCASLHPTLKAVIEEYKDEIRYIYRNFPLTYHSNGKTSAYAAEAASLQGKYWEMHNKIFETQSAWEELSKDDCKKMFVGYAKTFDLDIDKFESDMQSDNVSKKVEYDQSLAYKVGVDSTPSLYLNGKKLDSKVWGDNDKFKAALDEQIKKAN